MQPNRRGLSLTEKQVEQFNAHLASKSVHVRCPFCGHDYGHHGFVFVPAGLADGTPVSWSYKLVRTQCNNCGHVAHFDVPLDSA